VVFSNLTAISVEFGLVILLMEFLIYDKANLQLYLDKAKMGKAKFKEYKTYTFEEILTEEEKQTKENKAPTPPSPVYFYHPDHLGTSTFLIDFDGNAYQFFLSLPFRETMAEQKEQSSNNLHTSLTAKN
jgi:hypothetical protein